MPLTHVSSICFLLLLLNITACSRYSLSVNENVVYEPPHLFNDYLIEDSALRKCVRGTIAENGLTKAEQLTHLLCPPGDIENIKGLATFNSIQYLGLKQNRLVNIDNISALRALRHVDLSHNNISDFSPLARLPQLEFVKAIGNHQAICSSLLLQQTDINVERPKQCD